ncbi:MAG: hypothetical protein Q7R43_01970 [Candidatus Daviesbacteria bacterium]|nr:hypothetical protein [Candidatus Daviesbacteria bacterium]
MPEKIKSVPDFREIFYQKLDLVTPFSKEEGGYEANFYDLDQIGVFCMKRKAPVLMFCLGEYGKTDRRLMKKYGKHIEPIDFNNWDIWLKDPKSIENHRYPHWEVEEDLIDFLREHHLLRALQRSAFIIQDDRDKLFLWADGVMANSFDSETKTKNYFFHKGWINLFQNYGLEKFLGRVDKTSTTVSVEGYELTRYDFETVVFFDSEKIDLISKEREERYCFYTALDYKMTNSQYLRFRCLVDSAKEALMPTNFKKVAQNIIELDKS